MAKKFAVFVTTFLLPFLISFQSPLSPLGSGIPAADPGAYLYTGWRLLHGARLYIDVWDHKGPAIYLLNALGLILGGGSSLGVWALNALMLCAGAYLCYRVLLRVFDHHVALAAAAFYLLSLVKPLQELGYTEDAALPFIWTGIYVGTRFIFRERGTWLWGVIGGCAFAVVLCLRQNLAGPFFGAFVGIVWSGIAARNYKLLRHQISGLFVGFVVAMGCFMLFIYSNSSFAAYKSAVMDYNILYSKVPMSDRLYALLDLFMLLVRSAGASILMSVGIILLVPRLFKKDMQVENAAFWWAAIAGAVPTIAMSALSGRGYEHYAVMWAPYVAIFSGVVFQELNNVYHAKRVVLRRATISVSIVLLSLFIIRNLYISALFSRSTERYDASTRQVADWIEQMTAKNEPIFVWGDGGPVCWAAQRRSASKFFYNLPILTAKYKAADVDAYVAELRSANAPALIDRAAKAEFKVTLKPSDWSWPSPQLAEFYGKDLTRLRQYVTENYRLVRSIDGTDLYLRKDLNPRAARIPTGL